MLSKLGSKMRNWQVSSKKTTSNITIHHGFMWERKLNGPGYKILALKSQARPDPALKSKRWCFIILKIILRIERCITVLYFYSNPIFRCYVFFFIQEEPSGCKVEPSPIIVLWVRPSCRTVDAHA